MLEHWHALLFESQRATGQEESVESSRVDIVDVRDGQRNQEKTPGVPMSPTTNTPLACLDYLP